MPKLLDEIDNQETNIEVNATPVALTTYVRKEPYEIGFERHVIENLYGEIREECKSKGIQWDLSGNTPWQKLELMAFACFYPQYNQEELLNNLKDFKTYLKRKGLDMISLIDNRDLAKYHGAWVKWKPMIQERDRWVTIPVDENGEYAHIPHTDDEIEVTVNDTL